MPSSNREVTAVVAELLADRIRAKGYTQMAIAVAAGMSQSQLSRCLSGQRRWDLDQLVAVCGYIGTRASDVLAVAEDTVDNGGGGRAGPQG